MRFPFSILFSVTLLALTALGHSNNERRSEVDGGDRDYSLRRQGEGEYDIQDRQKGDKTRRVPEDREHRRRHKKRAKKHSHQRRHHPYKRDDGVRNPVLESLEEEQAAREAKASSGGGREVGQSDDEPLIKDEPEKVEPDPASVDEIKDAFRGVSSPKETGVPKRTDDYDFLKKRDGYYWEPASYIPNEDGETHQVEDRDSLMRAAAAHPANAKSGKSRKGKASSGAS